MLERLGHLNLVHPSLIRRLCIRRVTGRWRNAAATSVRHAHAVHKSAASVVVPAPRSSTWGTRWTNRPPATCWGMPCEDRSHVSMSGVELSCKITDNLRQQH